MKKPQGGKRFFKLQKSDSIPECQPTIRALEKLTVHFFGVIVRQGAATQERLQKSVMSFLQCYHCLPSGWKRIVFPSQPSNFISQCRNTYSSQGVRTFEIPRTIDDEDNLQLARSIERSIAAPPAKSIVSR